MRRWAPCSITLPLLSAGRPSPFSRPPTSPRRSLVEPLLHDVDRDVRAEALVYLAQCGHLDPLAHLTDLDDVHGSAVASAVAHFLARPGPAQNMDAVRVLLDVATSGDGSDRHLARMEAARLIGSLPDQFEEQLNSLLQGSVR